jgi:hypothetical protein
MTLRERWRSFPRAARWTALAAAFLVLYFTAIEPALDLTASWTARADAIEAAMIARRDPGAAQRDALAASRFGTPLLPGGPERSAELNARVEQVLRGRDVGALTIRARAPVPLGRSAFAGLVPESVSAQRLILDVDFECDPALAAAILADLEQAPEVAAVNRVILRRDDREGKRLLRVTLSPEAWVFASKGAPR